MEETLLKTLVSVVGIELVILLIRNVSGSPLSKSVFISTLIDSGPIQVLVFLFLKFLGDYLMLQQRQVY